MLHSSSLRWSRLKISGLVNLTPEVPGTATSLSPGMVVRHVPLVRHVRQKRHVRLVRHVRLLCLLLLRGCLRLRSAARGVK